MTRILLALAFWISLGSFAPASVSVGKKPSGVVNEVLPQRGSGLLDRLHRQATVGSAKAEFAVTEQTEILLNGQPCKYAQVPDHARIVHMEVAADKRTVLRIEFELGD